MSSRVIPGENVSKPLNFTKLPPISAKKKDFYQEEIKKKRHKCTDVICLLIFLVFILAQIALSILIYVFGSNPKNILYPHDSLGKLCSDSTPYLLYFNLADCLNINTVLGACTTTTVCVSQCPNENLFYLFSSHRNMLLKSYCVNEYLSAYFNGSIPTSVSEATFNDLINRNICPMYVLTSQQIFRRCFPSFLQQAETAAQELFATDQITNITKAITDQNQPITTSLIRNAATSVVNLINLKGIAQSALEDFNNSYVLIIVLVAISAVVSFIYIILLRWLLAPLLLLTVLTLIGVLSYGIYYSIDKYITLKNSPQQSASFQFSSNFQYYLSLSYTWLAAGIILGLALVIILLLILFLIKRVRIAIRLIGEASRAVTSVFLSLLFPLIPLLLQLGLLCYFVINAVVIACAGNVIFKVSNSTGNSTFKVGDSCVPSYSNYKQQFSCIFNKYGYTADSSLNSVMGFLNTYSWIPQFYNLFMFFWTQAFVIGFNQMVLASCFGIWYWSKSKERCIMFKGIKDTFVYHLGSVAFGALLIAICKLLRTIIQIIERRLKSVADRAGTIGCCLNCFICFISCCCKCCFLCLEHFLKFMNRNAYIMVGIYGSTFCKSARDALALLAANPLRAIVLDRITDFALFLGRFLITMGIGVLAFNFFAKNFYIDPYFQPYFAPDLHYYWLPLAVTIVMSYFVSKVFFSVFEMAVDTIFLCAMKDLDEHDGSPENPYYMSKRLHSILKKKFHLDEDSTLVDKKAKASEAKNESKI